MSCRTFVGKWEQEDLKAKEVVAKAQRIKWEDKHPVGRRQWRRLTLYR